MVKHNKRQHKSKASSPDEVFAHGPMKLARFGQHLVMQTNWTEKGHAEMIAKLAASYPAVVQEIDDLVARIVAAVGVLPPDRLMHRAWTALAASSLHVKAEADVTEDDGVAFRMVDYVQSVIAAAPRGDDQKTDVSDDAWLELRSNVSALFKKINFDYPNSFTADRKLSGTAYDDAMEEFLLRARSHWCNVRGNYYQVHQVDIIADLLRPQSTLIEAAYGITSDALSAELGKIWHSLIFGLGDAITSFFGVYPQVIEEAQRMIEQRADSQQQTSVAESISQAAERLGHGDTWSRGVDAFGQIGLFDLRKITNLPVVFLDDFSWAPGQDTDFLADGEFKGWPLRIQPVFRRPFLKFNETHYCFELHSLFDNFYRQLEKRIFQRSENEKQEWIRNRKEISERLPIDYFSKLLPGSTVYAEAYYPVQTAPGARTNMTEADCVIAYDDHLFIIEVKAGAFTYTSPANDLPAYVNSLKALVEAPTKQGQRFLKYLDSAEEVDIFDAKKRPVAKLRKRDFRCITICAVTLDPFTELAAQAQQLHKIGVDVGDAPVWPLSLGDLRVYSDIFAGPLDFLHFVEQRMRAASSAILELNDELDHIGLYLEHNNYAMHASELAKNAGRLHFNGYRSAIDLYFSNKLAGADEPSLPTQKVPARLRQVVDFLANQIQPHRSKIASYLLDIAGDWRSDISKWIEEELALIQQRGRCLPMSTSGSVRLTIFVNISNIIELSNERTVKHVQAAMIASGDTDRTLLELTYRQNELTRVTMATVTLSGLSQEQLALVREQANGLKENRLARSVANFGKIGRNELCPCGSGEKFKRCCMPRT